MPDDRKKTAAVAGVGITAGVLATLLATRAKPAAAAAAEGLISLDDAAMQALISILEHTENLDADLDQVIDAINRVSLALGVVGVSLLNPPEITAFTVFTTALTTPVQLPDRTVPYDKDLIIKALHTNTGVILVGSSIATAMNANSSYWLIANEAVEYKIRNADHIFIGCHPTLGIVGDGIVCTVEQEASR